MGQSNRSMPWASLSGEAFCKAAGHKARRYGDCIACENCDKPMKEEDLKPIVIHHSKESEPDWLHEAKMVPSGNYYRPDLAEREQRQ